MSGKQQNMAETGAFALPRWIQSMAAAMATSDSMGNKSVLYLQNALGGAGLAPNLHCALSTVLLSHL